MLAVLTANIMRQGHTTASVPFNPSSQTQPFYPGIVKHMIITCGKTAQQHQLDKPIAMQQRNLFGLWANESV